MDLLVIMFFILLVIIFSIVGFVNFIYWLQRKFLSGDPSVPKSPSLSNDVAAAGRLLNHLYSTGAVEEQTYYRMIRFLTRKYDCQLTYEPTPKTRADKRSEAQSAAPELDVARQLGIPPTELNDPIAEPPAGVNSPAVSAVGTRRVGDELIEAELVAAEIVDVAPWDRPDPPSRAPRRSISEILSGFMQAKNMRWGELTSGILIVLSAVGLVVSLRDELSDTIPYFSSILFMLITAAIIGAGIYTLKKWKLRNTSRGTLVIGMLLIPLNFVAACVLSGGDGRRELSDPWLWIALFVGFSGFSAMAWYAGKFLLRKQQWPLTVVIVGCGAGTILLNRLTGVTNSSPHVWLLSCPLIGSFLVGAGLFESRIASKGYWSGRGRNRLLLRLGISSFAILAAISLLMIRSETKMAAAVAVTPVLIIVSLLVSRTGLILCRRSSLSLASQSDEVEFSGSGGILPPSNFPTRDATRWQDAPANNDAVGSSVIGWSLQILGLILTGIFLFASLSNPTVFAVNCLVGASGLSLISIGHAEYRLLPAVWALLAAGVLVGLNLAIGNFEFDGWTSAQQLRMAIVNGKSGLCLLVSGAVAAGGQWLFARFVSESRYPMAIRASNTSDDINNSSNASASIHRRSLVRSGNITGGAIFLAGCSLALLASLLNRGIVFDNFTASGLLLIASLGALAIGVVKSRNRDSNLSVVRSSTLLLQFGTGLLLIALLHALIWNLTISDWFAEQIRHPNANWVWAFALHGAALGVCAVWMPVGANQIVTQRGALATTIVAVLGAVGLVPQQTGNGTVVMMVVVFTTGLLVWTLRAVPRMESTQSTAKPSATIADSLAERALEIKICFHLATLLFVVVVIGELASRWEWCPAIEYRRHWLIQAIGISGWSVLWTLRTVVVGTRGSATAFDRRSNQSAVVVVHETVGFGLVGLVAAVSVAHLGNGATLELVRGAKPFASSLVPDLGWFWAAIASIATAMFGLLLQRPTAIKGAAMILLWLLAWASGAAAFENSQSVASAIRWLLPIGGLVVAMLLSQRRLMIPAWVKFRNYLNLSGRSSWQNDATQRLINFLLAMVVVGVLLISTVTVSQVMLNGGAALGGPLTGSWFGKMDKVVSFGGPLGLVVGTFLLFAISERRQWLATAGSLVFQYMVVLAIVLLFLSPHPKLASAWFLRVLQSMSLGMTVYGFFWWWFIGRISGGQVCHTVSRWSQIDTHTLINGLLVTSLAALVFARFFWVPDQAGDWINSVGSFLGVAAWLLFTGFAFVVWSASVSTAFDNNSSGSSSYSRVIVPTAIDWLGLVFVAMIGAVIDYQLEKRGVLSPWWVFQVLALGAVVVGTLQVIWQIGASWRHKIIEAAPTREAALSYVAILVGLGFAVRGIESHSANFWFYEVLIGTVAVLLFMAGLWMRRTGLSFAAASVSLIATAEVVRVDPASWFTAAQPYWINLSMIVVTLFALSQLAFYLYIRRANSKIKSPINVKRSFVRLPNVTLLFGSIWILVGSWYQYLCSTDDFFGDSSLVNPLGITAVLMLLGLLLVSLANDRRRFWVVGICLTSIGLVTAGIAYLVNDDTARAVGVLFGCAAVVMSWGMGWQQRHTWLGMAKRLGAVRLASLKKKLVIQLSVFSLIVGAALVLGAVVSIVEVEQRLLRYGAAAVPLLLAIGTGCLSNENQRRGMQLVSLSLVTLGALLIGWADLHPHRLAATGQVLPGASTTNLPLNPTTMLDGLVRGLVVLAGAMFVYGGLVARWARAGDRWLKSLREMAAVTCGLAIVFLGLVIGTEAAQFREDVGCGLSIASAGCVALVVAGMIVGLVAIAVRSQRDPFSISLTGRQAYVYLAQVVVAGLVAHLYFSLPWLFRIGIKDYWPYVAMVICFGGVGVSQLLEKRNLIVLAQPLFNTAAIFPVLIAVAMTIVKVPAVDGALVMLTVGLAYLMISYLHPSMLSGAAAIFFGNLALWMFYGRFPSFSFFDHPQLWLIPPAISVLIAGQLNRAYLTKSQLALLRYVCVAVIYVSSTSEIFISGLKDHLWPPMVLATLSVGGIMAGMLMQIRAFLYLGSLFLLTAMITMVSHAQQRLDHFWPWWVFGITLGIAILVMFGLFEKKKKELKGVAERLREWES